MKTASFFAGMLCLSVLAGCRAEPVDSNDNTANYLTTGQWKVREWASAATPAHAMTDYRFTFGADGRFTALRDTLQVEGAWSIHQKVEGRVLQLTVRTAGSDASALSNEWDLQYSDPTDVKLSRPGTTLRFGRP